MRNSLSSNCNTFALSPWDPHNIRLQQLPRINGDGRYTKRFGSHPTNLSSTGIHFVRRSQNRRANISTLCHLTTIFFIRRFVRICISKLQTHPKYSWWSKSWSTSDFINNTSYSRFGLFVIPLPPSDTPPAARPDNAGIAFSHNSVQKANFSHCQHNNRNERCQHLMMLTRTR